MGHQLFYIPGHGIETFFLQTKPWDENFFIPLKTFCNGTIPVINTDRSLQWYEPRDVRVKVKSSKGNPGSTDLISDRLCDMV